jgi:flagellar protein FlaG
MTTELAIGASSGQSLPAGAPKNVSGSNAVASPVPDRPRLTPPKPIELQFDEARSRQNVQAAVSQLNAQMSASKTGLGFSIDDSLAHPVVTVRNTQTGEVVRQIPNEAVVRVAHSIDQLKGLLLNVRV